MTINHIDDIVLQTLAKEAAKKFRTGKTDDGIDLLGEAIKLLRARKLAEQEKRTRT